MSSEVKDAVSAALQLCSSDDKFVGMTELFRKLAPEIKFIDFLQPNSKLRYIDVAGITNLHIYSLLSFHFVRGGPKNKNSASKFIGTKEKRRKGKAIYFSIAHVTSICNIILQQNFSTRTVTNIWHYLDKSFNKCSSKESERFSEDSTFGTHKWIRSTPASASTSCKTDIRPSRSTQPTNRKDAIKRPAVSSSVTTSKPKKPKIASEQSTKPEMPSTKNWTYVHRSTIYRQAAQIKNFKNKLVSSESKLVSKEAECIVLSHELQKSEAAVCHLQNKIQELESIQFKVCKNNKELAKKLEESSKQIHYLTDRLLFLESIQGELNAAENLAAKNIDEDPDFELVSKIKKVNEEFDKGVDFPKIDVRSSIKNINPAINLGITLIRRIGRVSDENTMPLFVALANSVFGQNWNLGNYVPKKRLRHTLPPSSDESSKHEKIKKPITKNTMPSKSYIRSFEKNVLEPAALKSSADAIKNCDVASLIFDHMSIDKSKAITVGVMTGTIDPDTKKTKSHHMTLAVKQVVDTTATGTYRSVIEVLRLAAASAAESGAAEHVQNSFKQLLSKLMYQVTDDASQMRPVNEKMNELIKLLGIDGDMIFIHCNAHIVPALDTGVTKCLVDVENFLQISEQMVRSFNQSFHKTSNSTIETMVRAIFRFIGDSLKNESWAMTNDFQTFLEITSEDGDKNFFKNPDSSKFGLSQEMCFILTYSFDSVKEFIERVYAPNNMYRSCSLYMECPYFRECILSITLLFYHITAPFLVAVGSETQYGYNNLSQTELLKFFPLFIKNLESLTEDPSPYLVNTRLEYLEGFQKVCTISKKKYREMFDIIFMRISSSDTLEVNLDVVKMILKLFTEEYLIVIDRQAKEFYIGDDSVVAKELKKRGPEIMNLVATTSLAAEHSVGVTRQDRRRAPCASISTLSLGQTFKSSPLGHKILNCEMTPKELGKIMLETRKSGAQKLKQDLTHNDAEILKSEKKAHFAILEANKKKIVQKKMDIAAAVKNHGGPIQSPEEVDSYCNKFIDNRDELKKIIALELSYQKSVICNNSVPDSRYKEKTLNKATKKYDYLSLEKRIENLKAIVKPIDESTRFNVIDANVFLVKAAARHSEMKKYPHRQSDFNEIPLSVSQYNTPFFVNLHTQTFIAVHCIEETEIWYPAKIATCHENKNCSDCSPLKVFHGNYRYCFEVQFMEKVVSSDDTFSLKTPLYHVPASQVIPCLPKIVIKAGKSRRSKLKYIVNNSLDILAALENNILFAYRKANSENLP